MLGSRVSLLETAGFESELAEAGENSEGGNFSNANIRRNFPTNLLNNSSKDIVLS